MQCMTSGASVNAIGNRKEKAGEEGTFRSNPCPAKGRKCEKSLKYGHFASCCKGNHFPLESG